MFTLRPRGRAAFAAVLMFGTLGATSSAASAATLNIANSGDDTGNCVATPCATLEYAQQYIQIGDTVRFAAGVYPIGNATLGTPEVTYERAGAGEVKITLPADSYGVQIGAPGVTLRDLTLTSPDDTVQADTYGLTYSSTGLTLDRMRVEHLNRGVVGGDGITVTDSVFTDVPETAIALTSGHAVVTNSEFASGTGIHVTDAATVTATGNVFHGKLGGGGNGLYLDDRNPPSPAGIANGNRFSPLLGYGINSGAYLDASNNWWGCNEGIENPGCVDNYDLPPGNTEPHLVLDLSATPDPFLTSASNTVTASLISTDPEIPYTGGPIATTVALATDEGTLDDASVTLDAGSAATQLRNPVRGLATLTATLDAGTAETTAESVDAQSISYTSTAPTGALVGGASYTVTATGGASAQPVVFTIDAATASACSISGGTVSFLAAGTCTINANQASDVGFAAAAQVQQSFVIAPAAVISASLNPTSFAFDAVTKGSGVAAQSKTFTLANTGNRDITFSAATLTGTGQADFAIGGDSCTGSLEPDETCTYAVSFVPVADATYVASSNLRVEYMEAAGDPGSAVTITSALSGQVNKKAVVVPDTPTDTTPPPTVVATPSTAVTPPAATAPLVLPLELNELRAPVRCLTVGAKTPNKSFALQTNAKATVSWSLKKVRGNKALSACPAASKDPEIPETVGKTRKKGTVATSGTDSARLKLAALLPAKGRNALEPGLYRVSFTAANATGSSPERAFLIRILKARR